MSKITKEQVENINKIIPNCFDPSFNCDDAFITLNENAGPYFFSSENLDNFYNYFTSEEYVQGIESFEMEKILGVNNLEDFKKLNPEEILNKYSKSVQEDIKDFYQVNSLENIEKELDFIFETEDFNEEKIKKVKNILNNNLGGKQTMKLKDSKELMDSIRELKKKIMDAEVDLTKPGIASIANALLEKKSDINAAKGFADLRDIMKDVVKEFDTPKAREILLKIDEFDRLYQRAPQDKRNDYWCWEKLLKYCYNILLKASGNPSPDVKKDSKKFKDTDPNAVRDENGNLIAENLRKVIPYLDWLMDPGTVKTGYYFRDGAEKSIAVKVSDNIIVFSEDNYTVPYNLSNQIAGFLSAIKDSEKEAGIEYKTLDDVKENCYYSKESDAFDQWDIPSEDLIFGYALEDAYGMTPEEFEEEYPDADEIIAIFIKYMPEVVKEALKVYNLEITKSPDLYNYLMKKWFGISPKEENEPVEDSKKVKDDMDDLSNLARLLGEAHDKIMEALDLAEGLESSEEISSELVYKLEDLEAAASELDFTGDANPVDALLENYPGDADLDSWEIDEEDW